MTTPQRVEPEAIEEKLIEIWEQLAKENTMRACLFNLIVFNRCSNRTDYIRSIVNKVIEKFPCRLIFISEDPKSPTPHLNTTVSVIMPQGPSSTIACDHIDIDVAGDETERVPYLLLPHILPDLPVTLLWVENPCLTHPLFTPLLNLSDRIIFDSESSDNLLIFSETVLQLKQKNSIDIADLNWARTEGWRDLLISIFDSEVRVEELKNIAKIKIVYNGKSTENFLHLKIQSLYLLSWLSSRMNWHCKKAVPGLHFEFEYTNATIEATDWEQIEAGAIISVTLINKKGQTFECSRIKDRFHYVSIQISSEEKCDLPYQFLLDQTATGPSLVKEICVKGTSKHYLEMLRYLKKLDQEALC